MYKIPKITNTKNGDFMDINYKEILDVIIRALLSMVTLFLVTKMLGKKQVSQLSLFDYVVGISIGNFAAEMTINLDSHYLHGTVAVIIFGLVAYAISILTMKSITLRRYFMGTPTILIDNGEILIKGLKKVHYDINDLLQQCRSAGYFDLEEIGYAIMEANGELSILPKSEYKNVTTKDMKIKADKETIRANVIIDGKIMKKVLQNKNKTESWLENELKKKKVQVHDVLLATLDDNNKLNIYKKIEKEPKQVLE